MPQRASSVDMTAFYLDEDTEEDTEKSKLAIACLTQIQTRRAVLNSYICVSREVPWLSLFFRFASSIEELQKLSYRSCKGKSLLITVQRFPML